MKLLRSCVNTANRMKFVNIFLFNYPNSMTFQSQHLNFLKFNVCRLELFCHATSAVNANETQLANLNETASKIIKLNSKFDVMASCIPIGIISKLLKHLFGLGFSERSAVNLLTRSMWTTKKPELLIAILDIFTSYNLTPGTMIHILENLPLEFREEKRPLEDLPDVFATNFEGLRKLGFTEDDYDTMLSSTPQILFLGFEHCLSIMSKLNGLVDTKVKVIDLVIKYPYVLIEDWDETTRKFEYVYYEMVYEIEEIAHSSIFTHSFDHIKDRHVYLTRTGFFMQIKRKDDEKTQNPNPPLKTILDSSDSQFAKMFGNLRKEEYSVYLQMRKLEKENEESNESDSEDETK